MEKELQSIEISPNKMALCCIIFIKEIDAFYYGTRKVIGLKFLQLNCLYITQVRFGILELGN